MVVVVVDGGPEGGLVGRRSVGGGRDSAEWWVDVAHTVTWRRKRGGEGSGEEGVRAQLRMTRVVKNGECASSAAQCFC